MLTSEQPSYQQPNVNAILRLDSSSFVQELGLSGSLLCVTDEQILISSFILDSQAVPRRLETKGNPQRLAYSKHLNKIIVVLDELNFERGATLEEPLMKRKLRPALQFIDPEEKFQTSNTEVKAHVTAVGEPGDRFTSIMNWTNCTVPLTSRSAMSCNGRMPPLMSTRWCRRYGTHWCPTAHCLSKRGMPLSPVGEVAAISPPSSS